MSQLMNEKTIIGEPEVVEHRAEGVQSNRLEVDGAAWLGLKEAVTHLRPLQVQDGSIPDAAHHTKAGELVGQIAKFINELAPLFPHDVAYLTALVVDFERWQAEAFGVPDVHAERQY